MKQSNILIAFLFFSLVLCAQKNNWHNNTVYDIFPGDYADPSILRDGKDFYITHSTSNLLIWHSTDLLHWKPIARALPNYTAGSAWAPELIKYHDKYFIYYPLNGKIFVVWADKPAGPWSEPVMLNAEGIDPGVITSKEGKRYLYINDGKMAELSEDGLSLTTGFKQVYDGWQYPKDWAVECFCLESPKLMYHNGYYFLTSAEGGTSGPSTSHMAVVARSESPLGPWENNPDNPLVHTTKRSDAFVSKGHATLFADSAGEWYAVYHAYKRNELPLGRHTLLEKITWTSDNWPQTVTGRNSALIKYETVANTQLVSDSFNQSKLQLQWMLTNVTDTSNVLNNDGIRLKSTNEKVKTLLAIVPDMRYEATIKLNAAGTGAAGLMVYYNDKRFIGLAVKQQKIVVVRDDADEPEVDAPNIQYIKLKMIDFDLSLLYSSDGVSWITYPQSYDMSGYQTNILRNFGSLRIAVFVKGTETATIKQFTYTKLK